METANQVPAAPRNFYLYGLACVGTTALMVVGAAYGLATHQDVKMVLEDMRTGGLLCLVSLMLPAALGLFKTEDLADKVSA